MGRMQSRECLGLDRWVRIQTIGGTAVNRREEHQVLISLFLGHGGAPPALLAFIHTCEPTTHRRAFSDRSSSSFRRLGPTAHRGDW
jgi:hypothetical protein